MDSHSDQFVLIMQQKLAALVVWAAAVCCRGEETRNSAVEPQRQPDFCSHRFSAPRAWFGIQVDKPEGTIAAQLPDLPRGIGFVVRSVTAGGPAENAGIREHDLVWKLGDQLLVNEGQLAALLRLRKPGETEKVSLFRGGKAVEMTVVFGEAPKPQSFIMGSAERTIFPAESGPMRVVNLAQKLASYSNEEGKAEVRKDDSGFRIIITKNDGSRVFEGGLNTQDDFSKLPDRWVRRAFALRRGLQQALASPVAPPRQPRPRIAAPSAAASSAAE